MQERGLLIAYLPSAAVYHSHGEPIASTLGAPVATCQTVVGNFLHLGSGGASSANSGTPIQSPTRAR